MGPLPAWPGDCFQRAGYEMIRNAHNPDVRLVHAQVPDSYNPGRWVEHAWVELPGWMTWTDDRGAEFKSAVEVCVDTAQPYKNARILPRDLYYQACTPRNIRRYTYGQMLEHALRHAHDGPWPEQ